MTSYVKTKGLRAEIKSLLGSTQKMWGKNSKSAPEKKPHLATLVSTRIHGLVQDIWMMILFTVLVLTIICCLFMSGTKLHIFIRAFSDYNLRVYGAIELWLILLVTQRISLLFLFKLRVLLWNEKWERRNMEKEIKWRKWNETFGLMSYGLWIEQKQYIYKR